MSSRVDAEQLVRGLSEKLNLPDLTLDENDSCYFVLDENILVMLEYVEDADSLVAGIIVGKLPDSDRESVLFDLLKANFYWNLTKGGTLGLDESSNAVVLSYRFDLPIDSAEFQVHLAELTSAAEYWRGRLAPADSGDGGGFTTPAPMIRA